METHFATARDGTKIHYVVRGTGAPLALIMGFTGSGRGWTQPFLQPLERRFRLLVIDNRGTGESDKPDKPLTIADMAADVVSVLDDARIDRTHVFGVSMGGLIAQELTLGHPQLVRGLVLGCTGAGRDHTVAGDPEALSNLAPAPGMPIKEIVRRAFGAVVSDKFRDSERGKSLVAQMVAEIDRYPMTPLHTVVRQYEAMMAFGSFDRLRTIKAPTLVICGDGDRILPWQNSEIVHREIPGAQLHILKGAGHMFPWEAPDEVVETISAFLSRVN